MKKLLELLNTTIQTIHTLLIENNAVDIAYLTTKKLMIVLLLFVAQKKAAQVFSNMDIKRKVNL
ncbi:MAG: hypothetical protein ACLR43_04945 [Faecalibacillus faecis]